MHRVIKSFQYAFLINCSQVQQPCDDTMRAMDGSLRLVHGNGNGRYQATATKPLHCFNIGYQTEPVFSQGYVHMSSSSQAIGN